MRRRAMALCTATMAVTATGVTATAMEASAGQMVLRRVSLSTAEVQPDGDSQAGASISGDGRYVAFVSSATNLVPGDRNGVQDVFLRDRRLGTTTRVNLTSTGEESADTNYGAGEPALSQNGRYVAFVSSVALTGDGTIGSGGIYLRDVQAGTLERVDLNDAGAPGNDQENTPVVSADGRFVAFSSPSTNLVADDTNNAWDIFVRDRVTATTSRVNLSSAGVPGNGNAWGEGSFTPSISPDGRFVSFTSHSTNLVPGDTNREADVFVHDRRTGDTVRVSVTDDGSQGQSGWGLGSSSGPQAVSADGRRVAFTSCTALVPDDTMQGCDIYVRDVDAGTTRLVSRRTDGVVANDWSVSAAISADGSRVAFSTSATNVISTGVASARIFLRDLRNGTTVHVDPGSVDGDSYSPAVDATGRHVAFLSSSRRLVYRDTNRADDIFVSVVP